MTKLKNSLCDKTQKLIMWQNSTCDKLKLWQNSNCEGKNQKLKSDKTQIVTKLENSNYDNSKLKFWQNFKKKLKLGQNLKYNKYQFLKTKKTLRGSFSKNILTPRQPMRCSLGSVLRFSQSIYPPLLTPPTCPYPLYQS